ncbi:MAG: hypothetical protein GF421_06260 [Candidatus Aminicenantes bacterium]|nr:hypothetical protein [Candidatus Aminicenantes bacterium]
MKETYTWNPYSDQPDISIPKKKRFLHHVKHFGSYISLASAIIQKALPILFHYRKYWNSLYKHPCFLGDPFAVSVSPERKRNERVVENLKETGASKTLVRVHSWEDEKLEECESLCRLLKQQGLDICIALLQERRDILEPAKWQNFIDEVFSRFKKFSSFFEIGHAWNRAKWGLWDHKEYSNLSLPAFDLARKHRVKLVGPAVIDFEFHLYPPILKHRPFDIASSLLYVDRVGAPENKQYGWDTRRKLALLRAVVDQSHPKLIPIWITEMNWPLKGTGKYSPVSGDPNVSEEEQASFLVRYYILCLASGFVERIYWWQLIAPGYGLIDSRSEPWRKRPSFHAFKTMVTLMKGSRFVKKLPHPRFEIFIFEKQKDRFAVIWAQDKTNWGESAIPFKVTKVVSRDGNRLSFSDNQIRIDGNPRYIYFT